jgi:hypothetical protein
MTVVIVSSIRRMVMMELKIIGRSGRLRPSVVIGMIII